MALSKMEKQYLKGLIRKELDHFRRDEKSLFIDLEDAVFGIKKSSDLPFLKAKHEYRDFLQALLKKLK